MVSLEQSISNVPTVGLLDYSILNGCLDKIKFNSKCLINTINQRFPSRDRHFPIALAASGTQIWLDDQAMKASGVNRAAIIRYLREMSFNGRPFYRLVLDSRDIIQERSRLFAEN